MKYKLYPIGLFVVSLLGVLVVANAQQWPTNIIGGYYYSSVPAFTLADKQAAALQLDANGNLLVASGGRPSYSAGILGMTLAANTTDVFCLQGSNTRLVKVKRIDITGIAGAPSATVGVQIVKRSTANTGGTATNPTVVAHDSQNAAATAVAYAYTANPTTGALVGVLDPFYMTASAPNTQNSERVKLYGTEEMQSIRLRGTSEWICVNMAGVGYVGSISIGIDWTEQ